MLPINTLEYRDTLGAWLNVNGLTGRMVEVGVAFGGYARTVLKDWIGKEYICVDPWISQSPEVYKERTTGINFDAYYDECKRMAEKDARVRLVKDYSVNAAKLFPDGCFDVVYIDGNHSREAVEADVAAWWPKLKSGGLFAGHDCYNAKVDGHYCEVFDVMTEWSARMGLPIHVTRCTSWWVIKP